MKPYVKRSLALTVFALGLLLGILALVRVGEWTPPDPGSYYWVQEWTGLAGVSLFALIFITASIIGLRNPRRAGLMFLASTPIATFLISYSYANFFVWTQEGGYQSSLSGGVFFGLTSLYLAAIFAPLAAFHARRRRAAVALVLILGVAAGYLLDASRETQNLRDGIAISSIPYLIAAAIWLGTARAGWPPFLRPRERPLKRRIGTGAMWLVAILLADLAATFVFAATGSLYRPGDCGPSEPRVTQLYPANALFTVRVVRVGHQRKGPDAWVGAWGIGGVEHTFWGPPGGIPHYVFLTGDYFWEGDTLLFDGSGPTGILTRFLPIEESLLCGRTRPLSLADVDLRVLSEGEPRGARLIGQITQYQRAKDYWSFPAKPIVLAGTKVTVMDSSGGAVATTVTDGDGIYQLDGLAPGDYRVKADLPPSQTADPVDFAIESPETKGIIDGSIRVFPDGHISGRVTDDAGAPAHASIEVRHWDGSDPGPDVRWSVETDKDGSFLINRLSAGEYRLSINPQGPLPGSPYAPLYYPDTEDPLQAQRLELSEGQRIENLKVVLHRLTQRVLQVHVRDSRGLPDDGAWVYVAYPNTEAYNRLGRATEFVRASDGGNAKALVFGDFRVRVFATDVLGDRGPTLYSPVVELDPRNLPEQLHLTLSSDRLKKSN